MKLVADLITQLSAQEIQEFEQNGVINLQASGTNYAIEPEDVEIIAEDVEGWQVTNLGQLTVALDVSISQALREEGLAREVINRIQNLRKDLGFEVTDKIKVTIENNPLIAEAVKNNLSYICAETLANHLEMSNELKASDTIEIEDTKLMIHLKKD